MMGNEVRLVVVWRRGVFVVFVDISNARIQGDGLNDRQKAECDHFVYIPQYGNGTGACATVRVCLSLSLSLFRVAASQHNVV